MVLQAVLEAPPPPRPRRGVGGSRWWSDAIALWCGWLRILDEDDVLRPPMEIDDRCRADLLLAEDCDLLDREGSANLEPLVYPHMHVEDRPGEDAPLDGAAHRVVVRTLRQADLDPVAGKQRGDG